MSSVTFEALRGLIGQLIAARKEKGISQKAVSESSGRSQGQLAQWERGGGFPSAPALVSWADALGLELRLVPREQQDDGSSESKSEPELYRIQVCGASGDLLATLHWWSSTEYHVHAPDGALIGVVTQNHTALFDAWAARVDVHGYGVDGTGNDPIVLAARLARDYEDERAPAYPAPGSSIPDQPGYVVGTCTHRLAASEWRAGFRTCERCPSPTQNGGAHDG